MKECLLYKKLGENKTNCTACAHRCIIEDGKTGICGVRKNIKGKLCLLVYEKPISLAIDPVEKKPLYHFMPLTKTFSFGTMGCNFKCLFCQNYDISQFRDFFKKGEIPGKEICIKKIVENAINFKCKSISYTYNEPTIFAEFVRDTSKLAHEKALKNIFVTNGYMTKEAFDFLTDENLIDAMNIDLKSMDYDF